MSASRLPLGVERYKRRRSHCCSLFLTGLVLGFAGGAAFVLLGVHRSWGM